MIKKLFLSAVAVAAFAFAANAQTNIQSFYDFGRGFATSTVEMFKGS